MSHKICEVYRGNKIGQKSDTPKNQNIFQTAEFHILNLNICHNLCRVTWGKGVEAKDDKV